ncbi:extracellular solute-binding protein [Pendulispora brunnea]|uniref:Extracellular solute-binding protein n=1 Tax=Pendulispora brunnea TaxID=2905690 RepID=A0ABZ2KC45_9BACT
MKATRREVLTGGAALLGAVMVGCKRGSSEAVVYTSVDQVFAEPVFRAIESKTGIKVRPVFDTEETKSTGVMNRIIAEGSNPQADVFWSGDPVRPLSLAKRGLVEPYVSPEAAALPALLRAGDGTWTGIAARARVLLVNTSKVPAGERPTTIRDLVNAHWKGRIALANPLFGTTTMHVAALASIWGDDALMAFLDAARANGARMASSNGEVKRLVASGDVAFGVTDTDDADEARKDGAPVEAVYPDQRDLGTLVIPSAVVRVRGGPHAEGSKKLIDGLLSADTEKRMAESGAHMPLRSGVPVPEGVRRVSDLHAMNVDFSKVADAMDRLQGRLKQWVGL